MQNAASAITLRLETAVNRLRPHQDGVEAYPVPPVIFGMMILSSSPTVALGSFAPVRLSSRLRLRRGAFRCERYHLETHDGSHARVLRESSDVRTI